MEESCRERERERESVKTSGKGQKTNTHSTKDKLGKVKCREACKSRKVVSSPIKECDNNQFNVSSQNYVENLIKNNET